ncbi:Uncharacterised protein [uncultured archaeon]|nr:Uncharacterised protein [uncultured archaeon]
MEDELQYLINTHNPKSYMRLLKNRPDIKAYLDIKQQVLGCASLVETMYCIYHKQTPELCTCGKHKLFNSFVKGYRGSCGSKDCKYAKQAQALSNFWQNNPDVKQQMMENVKKHNQEAYGVDCVFKAPEIVEKIEQTNLQKLGVRRPFQSAKILQKAEESLLESHGVRHPFDSKEIQQQAQDTYLANHDGKFMVEARKELMRQTEGKNPFQLEEIKEKSRETNLKNLGVPYASQDEDVKRRIVETGRKTNLRIYGVPNFSSVKLSEEAKKVLLNKDVLLQQVNECGVINLAHRLGVKKQVIYKRCKKYGFNLFKPGSSKYEEEIVGWLQKNGFNVEQRNRKIIAPKELDIYIPTCKLAIEFDGLYWHSESGSKDKWYHWNKTRRCQQKGIRLIHIFEDEWIEKKEICEDLLSRFLGFGQQKIFARKCDVREITNQECSIFLDENHIQGKKSASVNLGLFYGNQLAQLMTFMHSRFNKNIEWENIRCCNAKGIQVVGGVSRLWNHFIKKYNPQSVVSYCDRRWFTGETYRVLGFTLEHSNRPQYSYTDYEHRWNRMLFTKDKCLKKIRDMNIVDAEKLTEKEIATEILDLDRIWDCGNDRWVWKK